MTKPKWKALQVWAETHRRIKAESDRSGTKLYRVVDAMTRGWELLTPEQQTLARVGEPSATPSADDTRQSDDRRPRKQPHTAARRRSRAA